MQTEITKFDALRGKIVQFLEPLKGLQVRDRAENAAAKGALVTVLGLSKEIEGLRKAALAPLKQQVEAINARAKELTEPLDVAEVSIKAQMSSFAAMEQNRINEERRRADEAAARERKVFEDAKRAREVAANREAELAAKAKQEQAAFGIEADKEAEQKRSESLRQAQIEDNLRAERDRLAIEGRRKAEERRLAAEAPKSTRTVWKFDIVDTALIPEKYWIVNDTEIGAAVRAGLRDIPGVLIYSEQIVVAR